MMELSEIIESAVLQAVAARDRERQNVLPPAPTRLVDISPEPVLPTSEPSEPAPSQPAKFATDPASRVGAAADGAPSLMDAAQPEYESAHTQFLRRNAIAASSEPSPEAPAEVPGPEEPVESPLSPFKALVRRSYTQPAEEPLSAKAVYNPLDFYADVRFIPVMISRGVYQVLQLNPALRDPSLFQSHTLISHGTFSHTWSLLPLGSSAAKTNTVIRPISVLQTYGKGVPLADVVIRDYAYAWRAQAVHMRHYIDSWAVSGTHTAFQVCKDYVFEWKPVQFPRGSGAFELYLWRHNIEDGTITPAARVYTTSPFKSPVDNSELWSLEVDIDKIAPHIALMSSFAIKLPSAAIHSWFAPKEMTVPLPMPLVNFAFQDDGHVYQRLDKFYGDWEESRIRHLQEAASSASPENGNSPSSTAAAAGKVSMVQVFKREYIDQYAFPPEAIDLLNTEAKEYLEAVKARYGLN